jgi:hypothetical protein
VDAGVDDADAPADDGDAEDARASAVIPVFPRRCVQGDVGDRVHPRVRPQGAAEVLPLVDAGHRGGVDGIMRGVLAEQVGQGAEHRLGQQVPPVGVNVAEHPLGVHAQAAEHACC